MNNTPKPNDTEIKNSYNINSGVAAVVDENVRMELDEFGRYVPVLIDESQAKSKHDDRLRLVNAMSDESADEDEIAAELYAGIDGMQYDKTLGYYLDLYAGHVLEGDFRKIASSGEILLELEISWADNANFNLSRL